MHLQRMTTLLAGLLGQAVGAAAGSVTLYGFISEIGPEAWAGAAGAFAVALYNDYDVWSSLLIGVITFVVTEYVSVAVEIGSWSPADVLAHLVKLAAKDALDGLAKGVDTAIDLINKAPSTAGKVAKLGKSVVNVVPKVEKSIVKGFVGNDTTPIVNSHTVDQVNQLPFVNPIYTTMKVFDPDSRGTANLLGHAAGIGLIQDAVAGRNVGTTLKNDFQEIGKIFDPSSKTDHEKEVAQSFDNWGEIVRRGQYVGLNRPFLMGLKDKSSNVSTKQFWDLRENIKQAVKPVSVNIWKGLVLHYLNPPTMMSTPGIDFQQALNFLRDNQ